MPNRSAIQDAVKASQSKNSQNLRWVGEVVSADATGGLCLVNVRGKIISCIVPVGTQIIHGAQVSVSRVPGHARLVVNSSGNTTIVEQVAESTSTTTVGGGGTEIPVITPDTPEELDATALSGTEIVLEWSSMGMSTVDYLIERSLTSDPDDFEWLATVPVEKTTYTNTGLTASTQYWYRVRAKNVDTMSAYSNMATETTEV